MEPSEPGWGGLKVSFMECGEARNVPEISIVNHFNKLKLAARQPGEPIQENCKKS
jgi:hypothetical protein